MRLRLALSVVPLLCAPCLTAAAPVVPLSAFVHEDRIADPRLSPDGKHLIVTVRIPGKDGSRPALMMYAVPEMRQVGAFRMPDSEVPADYWWITNTRLAIAIGEELGSRERPVMTGEILAVDIDGGKQEYLYGYNMFRRSSKGKRYDDDLGVGIFTGVPRERNGRMFVSSYLWEGRRSQLYDIDSHTAARRLVADLPYADMKFLMDSDGKPRFASGIDDKAEDVLLRRDDASNRWEKIESAPGKHYYPFSFTNGDRAMLVQQSVNGSPERLVREELDTGKRTILFEDPVASVSLLMSASRFGEPFGAAAAVGRPRVRYFDEQAADARLHKSLSAQFPDHLVVFSHSSDDGAMLLLRVASDRDPGSYYLFNRQTMKAHLLFSTGEEIDPALMAERRPISFSARDGLALHGFLTMPARSAGDAKPPLVLLPHGGPHGPYDDWLFDRDAQFLASRGYAVLQVNFRGSGGRGPAFESAGYMEWGGKIQDDLVDGVRWAIAEGKVDGGKVCVYGASFGGYSAMMQAALQPAMYRCAVGYVGVYDLNLLAKRENERTDERKASWVRKIIGTDKARIDGISPVNLAARIKTPVLLVHGGKDKRAPLEHGEKMRDALAKAGNPPEWFLAKNEGHGFYDTRNVSEFYTRLEAFLAKHLK